MGLFHQTLDDINKLAQQGKLKEAKGLLDNHIKKEHEFQSDLAGLQGALLAFSHELRELQGEANESIRDVLPWKRNFNNRINNAKSHLSRVEALIIKLRRDRLELR